MHFDVVRHELWRSVDDIPLRGGHVNLAIPLRSQIDVAEARKIHKCGSRSTN